MSGQYGIKGLCRGDQALAGGQGCLGQDVRRFTQPLRFMPVDIGKARGLIERLCRFERFIVLEILTFLGEARRQDLRQFRHLIDAGIGVHLTGS